MRPYFVAGLMLFFITTLSSLEALIASQKTLGMAGTGIAFPQDTQTVAYHPAGMVDVGNRTDFQQDRDTFGLSWGITF